MFFYRIGSVFVLFECADKDTHQWTLTIYRIGPQGGQYRLVQSKVNYTDGMTYKKHYRKAVRMYRERQACRQQQATG